MIRRRLREGVAEENAYTTPTFVRNMYSFCTNSYDDECTPMDARRGMQTGTLPNPNALGRDGLRDNNSLSCADYIMGFFGNCVAVQPDVT